MNNDRNTLDCAIVGDLLSLYHDEVVSDVTRNAVESHLGGCESCRREYDELCAVLPPEPVQQSTGSRFASVMKRHKLGRILSIVLPILLAVAILVGGYFAQLYTPVVSMDDKVSIPQVFRYKTDEGTRFLFLFIHPKYEGVLSSEAHTEYTDDGAALFIGFERPLLVKTHGEELATELYVYDFEGLPGAFPSCSEVTEVYLGDTLIWSEAENGSDPVPAYVYEYDRFGRDDDILTWDVDYDESDPFRCAMTAEYADGRTVVWDFEGNVISEIYDDPCEEPLEN